MEPGRQRGMRHTTTKTISLPPAVEEMASSKAEELGVPLSTIVRWALEAYLTPRKKKKNKPTGARQ